MALCAPWVDASDVAYCSGDDLPPGMLARAVQAASELLYTASGRQFTGLCTDVVRPCRGGLPGRYVPWDVAWAAGPVWFEDGWRPVGLGQCNCPGQMPACGCTSHDALKLPNTPVVDVPEILVDGVALTDWGTIADDAWLVRTVPDRWPCCNRLDLPATEDGTWQVTYTWGTAVPEAGRMAAEVLACELAKGWSGQACKLPRRVTSLSAQGTTMEFAQVDAMEFFAQGRLGLYEVDSFISTHNPHRLQRRGRLISPRAAACKPRRVRVPAGAAATGWDGGSPSSTGGNNLDGGTPSGTGGDVISGGTP